VVGIGLNLVVETMNIMGKNLTSPYREASTGGLAHIVNLG